MLIAKHPHISLSATVTIGMVVMEQRLCACLSTMFSITGICTELRREYWKTTLDLARCTKSWGMFKKVYCGNLFSKMVSIKTKFYMRY